MAMKLEVVGAKAKEPEKTIKLEFRLGLTEPDVAFLVAKGAGHISGDVFAIRVDGPMQKFYVRKGQIEALGFKVVLE